jgi:diketogulonate reductase-like aldo/keto reductase
LEHSNGEYISLFVGELYQADISKGFVTLPKSVTKSRIEENANIFDFELSADDMKSLETGEYSPCSWDPTTSKD